MLNQKWAGNGLTTLLRRQSRGAVRAGGAFAAAANCNVAVCCGSRAPSKKQAPSRSGAVVIARFFAIDHSTETAQNPPLEFPAATP